MEYMSFIQGFMSDSRNVSPSPPQPVLSLVPEKKRRTEVCEKKMDELTKLGSFCGGFGVHRKLQQFYSPS